MKANFLIVFWAVVAISTNASAQVKKPVKNATIKNTTVKTGIKQASSNSSSNNCLPLGMKEIENVLRDRVARNMNLYLDRDYGFIEFMGQKTDLPIETYKLKKAANDWHYHLNDIRSNLTRVVRSGNKFVLQVQFETDKNEIKGKCPKCAVSQDKRAPDLNWRDPILYITLEPVAFNNSLTFDVSKVEMNGKLDVNGPMDKFMPSVAAFFQKLIEEKVEKQIKTKLNQPNIKDMLSKALKPEVDKLNLGKIVKVDDSKDNIYLCNY